MSTITALPTASKPSEQPLTPIVPREFVTKPFFPAKKQDQPRIIEYKGVTWTIGAPRLDGRGEKPPFDMRHGRVCFALLTFRDRIEEEKQISFSINELAHRVAKSNGGRYSQDLMDILYDLRDTWVRLDHPDGSFDKFSIIESIRIHGKPVRRRDAKAAIDRQGELWLDFVHLNPTFFGLLKDYKDLARIRLDVLTNMTSDVAQAIYCFLPSRAVHREAHNPFEINLATIMEQVGLKVPKYRSVRRQMFTQRQPSVLEQLDGAATMAGTLRVDLEETTDGSDFKLRAWVEKQDISPRPAGPTTPQSSLLAAWTASGRSRQEFQDRVKNAQPLNDHHVYLIQKARAAYQGNEGFYHMVAALLGHATFEMILSETKGDALEGNPGRNPTGRLIWRLMRAVRGYDA